MSSQTLLKAHLAVGLSEPAEELVVELINGADPDPMDEPSSCRLFDLLDARAA